ncbi:MAG: PQQ-binding-like beta-propeller repeat protein [Fuerstiella sp.]|nr:PQQ-binding-like beta-propeller repeat protein [Fuerstiella sp.]
MSQIWRLALCLSIGVFSVQLKADDVRVRKALSLVKGDRGVVAVLGLPSDDAQFVTQLAADRELMIYFQAETSEQAGVVQKLADDAGLLGRRVFVDFGDLSSIHLSHNLADAVIVDPSVLDRTSEEEVLRVLNPNSTALMGDRRLTKAAPSGSDDWSHPYHGPDNNPQSEDQQVRGNFQTQFIGTPKFSPMPEQSVIAGGRIYKAMGHIAHKANQNEMLNTLLCINAWNGTIQWKRPLTEGFLIHRNTMVAADDALYMGDHESCKVIDRDTGQVRREIRIPKEISDGPVWKWMALQDDILYALVGNLEVKVETMRSNRPGLGHWPWGMWKGHDYTDPRTAFGFGRTVVAIDRGTGEILWHYRDEEFLDARAVCMKNGKIFCFCAERFLACIDATNGELLWKNSDSDLLEAIGPNERAQHYTTGYATTCYMKCTDNHVFFAGPQRKQTVAASTRDGSLQWTHDVGNLQLVLREDAVYAAGPQRTTGVKLDHQTGTVLSSFPGRRACTRATGCADSIFFRASGGTVRLMTKENRAEHISPMRPPCQDGVLVSNGHLYWGPWMCGCQLSLYGNIGLRPIGDDTVSRRNNAVVEQESLVVHSDITVATGLPVKTTDWPAYRGGNDRSDTTEAGLAQSINHAWTVSVVQNELPTAPVAAGNQVFVADRTGAVRAYDADGNEKWKSYANGAVYYPPSVAHDRVFAGSADGRVYAFEAATGRLLWTYRVAPQDRRISVFGKLVSRWPVAGGVVVQDGTVYAAAGITHYDGTYIVALDAVTGQLKARNDGSGVLSESVNSGVSMQGNLMIVDNELRFLGGGVYETARFDLQTLECRNEAKHQVTSQYRTAFYPWYPAYGKYVSLEHKCGDGNTLCHDASYEGSMFGNLGLETPLPSGTERINKDAARDFLRRRGKDQKQPQHVWQDNLNRRFTSFVVSQEQLLATGHSETTPDQPFLVAISIADGSDLWKKNLPVDAVKGGTAVDATGHVFVSLEDGRLMCFK